MIQSFSLYCSNFSLLEKVVFSLKIEHFETKWVTSSLSQTLGRRELRLRMTLICCRRSLMLNILFRSLMVFGTKGGSFLELLLLTLLELLSTFSRAEESLNGFLPFNFEPETADILSFGTGVDVFNWGSLLLAA